jgi:hypothetical protein
VQIPANTGTATSGKDSPADVAPWRASLRFCDVKMLRQLLVFVNTAPVARRRTVDLPCPTGSTAVLVVAARQVARSARRFLQASKGRGRRELLREAGPLPVSNPQGGQPTLLLGSPP